MRLRKIEAFDPTKTQTERQKPKKALPKYIKFLIFILIMFSPVFIWKALTFNAISCNGIVMGQLELELGKVAVSEIKAPVDGAVSELYANSGSRVQKGSLLAVIKSEKDGTEAVIDIRASEEWVIISEVRRVGDYVKAGDVLYEVLPVGTYWIEAFVPEKYIGELSVGGKAFVYTISPRKKFTGKVDFISAEVETMPKMFSQYHFSPKRVFGARISLVDKKIPPGLLRFGMRVRCKIFKRQ